MGANGIYGLSGSGLDIESLVKVGTLSKESQYNKMYQSKTKLEWEKSEWSTLREKYVSYQSAMSDLKLSTNTNPKQAVSSNTGVVTATARSDAAAMSHNVTVNKLATNAYLMTGNGKTIERKSDDKTSINLADVIAKDVSTREEGDETIYTVDGEDHKGSDIAISINIADTKDGKAKTLSYTYEDIFNENAADRKTLNDLATDLAKNTDNITASYDSVNDSFSIYNKNSGEDNTISLEAGNKETVNLLNSLNLASYDGNTKELGSVITFTENTTETVSGSSAEVTIDGKEYTLDSNTASVGGVNYTFNAVSETGADGKKVTSSVAISQDTDKIMENVQKFVDSYNELLDYINEKLEEEKYSDYTPLTQEQENQMTKEQVEKWNEKAKSGLLYHNSMLRQMKSDLRDALSTPVASIDSTYNSAYTIGISTSTSNTNGHISLDTTKLSNALAAEPDCIQKLFTTGTTVSASQTKEDAENSGIAVRLYNTMLKFEDQIEDYAGTSSASDDQSFLGLKITTQQTKMSTFRAQINAYQTKLYEKYDAMEVALANLNVQLNYVQSAFS